WRGAGASDGRGKQRPWIREQRAGPAVAGVAEGRGEATTEAAPLWLAIGFTFSSEYEDASKI
ncbi:unnamed protein product, partial [Urochloa humidicola]